MVRSRLVNATCRAGQATQAYLEGDKALAKKLGASGRWHAAQMAKAHQLASEDIFRQRNPSPQGVTPDMHCAVQAVLMQQPQRPERDCEHCCVVDALYPISWAQN